MPAPWILPAGRAVLCIALAIAITFTGGHDARFGLVAFGLFAVATGVWLGLWLLLGRIPADRRVVQAVPAVVSLAAGIAALAVTSGGMGYLILLLSGWALITGAVELVAGLRAGRRGERSRDAIGIGALTIVLGVVVLVLPPDLRSAYSGQQEGVAGVMTSSIIAIGALGFWAAIVGVFEGITAASPRSPRPARAEVAS